jgi:hypothetical protein
MFQAGRPVDYMYDEVKLRDDIKSDRAKLEGLNAELNMQVLWNANAIDGFLLRAKD